MRRIRPLPLCIGWLILNARLAWAGPSDVAVRVSCSVLSEVSAAEFEARAKVDLSVRASRSNELEVVCKGLAARIRWRAQGGNWQARSMPASASPATLVDALLVASKELVEEAIREEASPARDASGEQGPATDSTASSAPPAADAATVERPDGRRPLSSAERAEGRDVSPTRAARGDRSIAQTDGAGTWAFGVAAGGAASLFGSNGTGMVGPIAGVVVELPVGLVTSLSGEYGVALGVGDIVSVRTASVAAVISAPFGPGRVFEVGVGGLAGGAFASSEAPYQPTSRNQAFWGAILRGRYAVRADAWRFAVGPDIRFYGVRPEVAVDGAYVWGFPVVSGGVWLEVRRALTGSK